MTRIFVALHLSLASMLLVVDAARAGEPVAADVDFDRQVRPILSDNCFQCHGPDEARREADLRLDRRDDVSADRGGYRVVTPGDLENSELYRRVTATEAYERMPPPDSGHVLSAEQIELIRNWILQGAPWERHWAFVPPRRGRLPDVDSSTWPRNPIDHFILHRLREESLAPSPEATKTTLIRRVTLDLTGLPPTPEEVRAFLADTADDAYDRLVDRLLASPRFGERLALPWLDAARYADTSGYQNDGPRYMWRWRDWVIDALNRNMPFDQFTIEQLAGDLLPNATRDQRLASGFNRNHRGNAEGGIIPEEYAVEYVVDRVDTTATVWLGLTMGCARCHDHKFDPISQREFYRFFAFFNNVPEFGRAIKEGNSPPWIKAPTARQEQRLAELDVALAQAERRFAALRDEIAPAQLEWEKDYTATGFSGWSPPRGRVARFPLDRQSPAGRSSSQHAAGNKGNKIAFRDGEPTHRDGVVRDAVRFDGRLLLDAGDVGAFGYFDKFSLSAWIRPSDSADPAAESAIISRVTDTVRSSGYGVTWKNGRIHVNLVKRWLDDAIRVKTRQAFAPNRWHHVCVTYDGSRVARGVSVYVDGELQPLHVDLDLINQSFATSTTLRIGGAADRRFVGLIDDVHIHDRVLSAGEVRTLATPTDCNEILAKPVSSRTAGERRKLRAYFLDQHAPAPIRQAKQELIAARQARDEYWEQVPTVMVMREAEQPRETRVLRRGQYDQPGQRVDPGTPACLPPLYEENHAPNRLALARWIVDPANPLTARVIVNRYWQMLFGVGLVETPEDFGSQGARPSHPRLLDWLAAEFVRTGWNVKAMFRAMATSATYRQASDATADLMSRDPRNRWLARGPRFRLSAETIRDQALAASGLLVERLGGPSLRPYQPAGLWQEIASDTDYRQSHGPGLYRRGLYTYWKRTVAPPSMVTFDAPARETCTVRRPRTNTPLQALTLMNDVTFVECSRVLAQRAMRAIVQEPARRIAWMFQRVTGRSPHQEERRVLVDGFHAQRRRFRDDPVAAARLVSTGEFPRDETLETIDLAAYTLTASLILNLDETVSKE